MDSTVQVSWVERWMSGSVKEKAKMFGDWVSRGLEKKVSLWSRVPERRVEKKCVRAGSDRVELELSNQEVGWIF